MQLQSHQPKLNTAGTKSGRDSVYKTHQYFDDAFYIVYDQIMTLYDEWVKKPQKQDLIIKRMRSLLKEAFEWHIKPVLLRLGSIADYKEHSEQYSHHVESIETLLDLKTSTINSQGRGKHSNMTEGSGKDIIPYIDDILYSMEKILEKYTPLESSEKPPSTQVHSDHFRQSLNITHP